MNDNLLMERTGRTQFDYRTFINNLRPLSIIRMPDRDQIRFCSDIDLVEVRVDRGYTAEGRERISFQRGGFSTEIIAKAGEMLDSEWNDILKIVGDELAQNTPHPSIDERVVFVGICALAVILTLVLGTALLQDPPPLNTPQTVQDQNSAVIDTKDGLIAALTATAASEDGN